MNAANAIHFIYTQHTFILMLPSFSVCLHVSLYLSVFVRACVCVCVCERERKKMANAARQLNLIATQLTLNFYLAIVFACVLWEKETKWECERERERERNGPTWVHCLRAKSARCVEIACAVEWRRFHRVCKSQKGDTKKVRNCDRGHFIN